jgi:hypothetical protein
MNDVAVLVAEHLDLDMARIDDEFLDEDAIVAEGGFRLGLGARKKPSATSARSWRCACPCRRRPPTP